MKKEKKMTPDEVCEKYSFLKNGIDIEIQIINETVVLKGNKLTLEFLGNLILSQANFNEDDGFGIEPKGPGKVFFKKNSQLGIYIKKIDAQS
jgi:hypothetical protein